MTDTPHTDAVRAASRAVPAALRTRTAAVSARDAAMRAAYAAGTGPAALRRASGLTEQQVLRILHAQGPVEAGDVRTLTVAARDATRAHKAACARRDEEIRTAAAAGVHPVDLVEASQLSRVRVHRIRTADQR